MWHRPWIMSHFPSWETPWQNPDLPVARAIPNFSVCHWAPRLALPSPKPRNPLCVCPGSTTEGEPKIALQQLGWPPFSAAPAKAQLKAGRKADLVGNGDGAGSFSTRDTGIKGWQPGKAGNRLLAPLLWVLADGWSRSTEWLSSATGTQALLKAQICISSLIWKWGRLSRQGEMLIPTLIHNTSFVLLNTNNSSWFFC